MIEHPERYIAQTAKLGAMMMNVHYEACVHLHRTIQEIHQAGMKAGVTLNPSTPVSVLEDIIGDVEMVLLMSVNPGFGGQKFIPYTTKKIRDLKKIIQDNNPNCLIEVDGGVGLSNIVELSRAGADIVVAGNAVFSSKNPAETIKKLQGLL